MLLFAHYLWLVQIKQVILGFGSFDDAKSAAGEKLIMFTFAVW